MIRAKPFYVLAAAVAAACATTPRADVAGTEAAIREINRQMEQAVASRNLDGIARLYTTDAVFMTPNAPAARGQAAIRANWVEALKLGNPSLRLTPTRIDVAASGDLANDVGTYVFSFTTPQGPVTDRGKYMVQFRKVGTEWRIANVIVISDLTAEAHQVSGVVVVPADNS